MSTNHDHEQIMKIARNIGEHYRKNWPFRYPESVWQKFLWYFMDFKWARMLLKGRFVKGEICWMWVNEHFDNDMASCAKAIEDYK